MSLAGMGLFVALGFLAGAIVLLALSAKLRRLHGLPGGRVVYSDTGAAKIKARLLYSARFGLVGKPDYLLATRQGLVPVEVKPLRDDPEPHESHLLQVLAYCLLIEDTEGKPPPYGLLRYRNNTFKVDYNTQTRAFVIGVIEQMRRAREQATVHRSHEQPGRCRSCLYAEICEEALPDMAHSRSLG